MPEILYAGELEIRPEEGLVLATGQALTLSVREFELLAAMARRQGRFQPQPSRNVHTGGSPG